MRNEAVLNLDEVGKVGIGAAVVAIVGAVFAYFRSIGNKVDKTEFKEWAKEHHIEAEAVIAQLRIDALAAVAAAKVEATAAGIALKLEFEKRQDITERRMSAWDQKSERFVTRDVIVELERKMDKMEGRIEASINKITDRLDKILEAHEK